MNESSRTTELLLTVSKDARGTLGAQIESQLRTRIRDGALRAGTELPSTRDLARQLSISRRVVVDAYAQLTAEGYLSVRQGARPRVAAPAVDASQAPTALVPPAPDLRFDFRPSMPDVTTFPRAVWARCLRNAATTITDADLSYGDPRGVVALRSALADYLGRVRGVVATTENVVITSGYTQALAVICRALSQAGARRIALESPADPEYGMIARRAGLEPVPVPVDADGIRVERLEAAKADAVAVTPAHQHPTGAVLSSARRSDWSIGYAGTTRPRSRTTTTPSTATTARPSVLSRGSSPIGSSTRVPQARRWRRRFGSDGSSCRRGCSRRCARRSS